MRDCECYQVGGRFIDVDPTCEAHDPPPRAMTTSEQREPEVIRYDEEFDEGGYLGIHAQPHGRYVMFEPYDQLRAQLAAAELQNGILEEVNRRFDVACTELRTRAELAEADAKRYQWLKERFFGANFDYELDEDDTMSALIFMLPEVVAVSANIDATIDGALSTGHQGGA